MKRLKYLLVLTMLITGCASQIKKDFSEPETVNNIDIEKYSGKWYEIASYPLPFQEGCMCTTAEYTSMGEYIKVFNQCLQKAEDNKKRKTQSIEGKAFVVEGSNNAKLKVQFFPPFKADYWIIDRDEDYSYAVVSNPEKSTLWILSRTPRMKFVTYEAITNRLAEKGFALDKLKRGLQHCGN